MEFFGFLPPASAPAAANNEVQLAGPFPDSIGVASPSTHAASPSSAADLAVPVFAPDEKMILEEPVQLKDFTAVHERALAYMRWRRDRAIAESHIAPSAEAARDDRLWRFLIAKQFDALAAGNMYVDMLRGVTALVWTPSAPRCSQRIRSSSRTAATRYRRSTSQRTTAGCSRRCTHAPGAKQRQVGAMRTTSHCA